MKIQSIWLCFSAAVLCSVSLADGEGASVERLSVESLSPERPVNVQYQSPVPGLLLANVYDDPVDLADYWVSEKLDGVRAYWNGRELISRQGNIYRAPAWFTAGFPKMPLDGELWMGRNTFAELSGAVRRQIPDDAQWRQIRYMVFDLPASELPFNQRLTALSNIVAACPSPYVALVEQFRLADHTALMEKLQQVVERGGEGLMLHRGSSIYQAARTDDLLKVKTYNDAEAVVIAHIPGSGKYAGMLGSLLVETPDSRQFRLGTGFSDAERANPPPVGSVVTFKYFGRTNKGTPRFASFMRVHASE